MNITSQCIKEEDRSQNLFGIHFPMTLEPVIYTFAERLAEKYCGGYWNFYELSNGGFYMAPDTDNIFPVISDNGYEGNMSADALGITACLYAYSHLSFGSAIAELCAEHYHLLRDFMLDHDEARSILAAID